MTCNCQCHVKSHTWLSVQPSLFRRWWTVSVNTHFSGGAAGPMSTSTTLAKFSHKPDAEKYLAEQKERRGL